MFSSICAHRAVTQENHVLWLDNFSRIYATQLPSIEVSSWRECLWTGYAALRYDGPAIDMAIRRNNNNEIIRAMPLSIVQMSFMLYDDMADVDRHKSILAASMVERWQVNNIPLRPMLDPNRNPAEYKRLSRGHGTQKVLYPGGVYPENIGSNRGLLQIFRDFCSRNGYLDGQEPEKYSVLTVDCNIYARIMKVMLIHII